MLSSAIYIRVEASRLVAMIISLQSTIQSRTFNAPKLENTSSLFTVSREDVFDFKRCPKIVAIKTYRTTRAKRLRPEADQTGIPIPNIVGQIGEAAAQLAFSGSVDASDWSLSGGNLALRDILDRRISHLIRSRLSAIEKRIQLDLELLARETIDGLKEIKGEIDQALGPLTIIGRGESRYGALPTCGYPDYVALTSSDRPVLIEVKNGAKESPSRDQFQASFYNSLGKTVGVIVHDTAVNNGGIRPNLQVHLEKDAETLILYPRLHKWRKVTDTVDIEPNGIEEVWSAKQLGALGRWPAANCSSDCPHRRYGIVLPEDNLDEVARPLPLIFAKGAADLGVDYNLNFIRRYISKIVPSAMNELWTLSRELQTASKPVSESLGTIMDRFGLGPEISRKLLEWLDGISKGEAKARTSVDHRKVEREMAAYLEPWRQLLPERMLDAIAPVAQSIASRTYSLPRQSNLLIDRSWKKWS